MTFCSGASHFSWLSSSCFYTLIWVQQWQIQLIGHYLERHTPVLKSHSWLHIKAKIKSWGRRNCLLSSETGLCRGTDLGKVTKNVFPALKVTKSTLASILLKWEKDSQGLLLEMAARPNWAIRDPVWRWEKDIQKSNHHCNTPPIWASKPTWSLQKRLGGQLSRKSSSSI